MKLLNTTCDNQKAMFLLLVSSFQRTLDMCYIYQFYLSLTLFQIVMRNRRVYLNIQVYVLRSIVSDMQTSCEY